MNEDFIEKYRDKLDWKFIIQEQVLSEKFLKKYILKIEVLDLEKIFQYQTYQESFIEKFFKKMKKNIKR